MAPRFDIPGLQDASLFVILPAAFIILPVIYVSAYCLYNIYFHPLSSFPGPKSFAASRVPYTRALASGIHPFKCLELHEKYGDVVRIGPNELSYNNGNVVKEIYACRPQMLKDKTFYESPKVFNAADDIINANHADHSRFRRLLSHAFSEKALREQEQLIKHYVDLFIQRLHENAGHKFIDIVAWYNYTTFDIIGDLAFGEPFQCLANSSYHSFVSMIFQSVKASSYLHATRQFPGLESIIMRIIPRRIKEHWINTVREQKNMASEKVMKRLELGAERPDFLSYILKHNDEKGMSVPEIKSNASILIIAGSETTATLLSGATYYLLRNPTALKILNEQIRGAFNVEDDITMASTAEIKYLIAVLNETLRMYPPVPVGLPRTIPEGGAIIDGTWIPAGTTVSLNIWSTSHSSTNFRDPLLFRPERWLGDPYYEKDNRAGFQPFSTGPRNCIGKNLAYSEMRLILTRLLWNFDIELLPESTKWADQKAYNLYEKGPLKVKLTLVVRD